MVLLIQNCSTSHLFVPVAMIVLGAASFLGVPALVSLGGTALILFMGAHEPIASIAVEHYALVINPVLPTLPLFTLAGYFLAEGGSPRRLIRLFYALFGRFPGGPAIVTVVVLRLFYFRHGSFGRDDSCPGRTSGADSKEWENIPKKTRSA